MRVYLYDTENGIYLGQDFCSPKEINVIDGITTLAPPSAKPGHVAVFDTELLSWKQVPIAALASANRV